MLGSFHGGVHPHGNKGMASHKAIEPLPMPQRLYVPLHQHAGQPCDPCVTVGQKVLKGEEIGRSDAWVSTPIHAPTSGTVVGIEEYPAGHPSGLTMLTVVIDPDGEDRWSDSIAGIADPMNAEPAVIQERIRWAGIVGLGGAVYPSFIKMTPPKGKKVETLLINGAECEPYLTSDERVMVERAKETIAGIEIMMHTLPTSKCVIGIEDNKPEAIKAMTEAARSYNGIRVQPMPAMYPQGARQQLVEAITGKQVPSGARLVDIGLLVHNVTTAYSIYEAVVHGKPLITRVVTVSGRGIAKPANLETLLGTPIRNLIDHCGGMKPGVRKVILGGPMMGLAVDNLDVPVVKGIAGVLALLQNEIVDKPEQPCIRCGRCVQACPMSLVPSEMAWRAKVNQLDVMPELHLNDCIECGSCGFVCPSNIPLVQYFRYAKLAIQADRRAQKKLDMDKARTKAKAARVEQEKLEKERQKEAMKAAMAARKKAAAEAAPAEAAPAAPAAPATETVAAAVATDAAPVAEGAAALSDAESKAARAARAAQAARAARAAKAAKEQA
ncbi:MAG: electron transport complex subunit RsxC [Magnetococcales bacterium]|nr:electron transport complex subunit RsxC [Magnetococcales bacterium]